MAQYCCEQCARAVKGHYFIPSHKVTVYIQRYSEVFYFPDEMRNLCFCPYCGKEIKYHIFLKHNCEPFLAGANKDYFVYNLNADYFPERRNSLLFNLLSFGEYESVSKYDYPEISAFSYCPYCGNMLAVRDGTISVERNMEFR